MLRKTKEKLPETTLFIKQGKKEIAVSGFWHEKSGRWVVALDDGTVKTLRRSAVRTYPSGRAFMVVTGSGWHDYDIIEGKPVGKSILDDNGDLHHPRHWAPSPIGSLHPTRMAAKAAIRSSIKTKIKAHEQRIRYEEKQIAAATKELARWR